jgi:hypothetical protein
LTETARLPRSPLPGVVLSALLAVLVAGCGHAKPPKPPPPPVQPLHLDPLTDLAPAAALVWLIDVHPRALVLDGRLSAAVAEQFPAARLDAFARAWGGIDPRETDDLVVASYPSTLLWLAHQFLDPARVEAAFTERLIRIEGRAIEGLAGDRRTLITRLWGEASTDHEQLAMFGLDAVGFEQGRFGPLRAAELFAEGRLKRASPALRADPLARVATLLGEAPVRAFAPGPFEGNLAHAVGGLLGASTAVGASARIVGNHAGLAVHVVVLGAWDADRDAASERLRAVFDILARSGLGRLLGLGHCLAGPAVGADGEALWLDFTVDAATFAKGLRAATAADAAEIVAP